MENDPWSRAARGLNGNPGEGEREGTRLQEPPRSTQMNPQTFIDTRMQDGIVSTTQQAVASGEPPPVIVDTWPAWGAASQPREGAWDGYQRKSSNRRPISLEEAIPISRTPTFDPERQVDPRALQKNIPGGPRACRRHFKDDKPF